MSAPLRTAASLSVAAAGGLAYAALIERRWWKLRHVTVPVLSSAARRPLRILHLSDLHLLPGQHAKQAFIRRCLNVAPEVVVATGDLLGHPRAITSAVELLGDVGRGRQALVVLGSNDLYAPTARNPARYLFGGTDGQPNGERIDVRSLIDGLTDTGWKLIDNRRLRIDTVAGQIDVAGLGDPHIGRDHPERIDWHPPEAPIALRLGVVHAPYLRALGTFARAGFDLVLAGHTHGGQLRLPGFGALVDNCDLPLRQARGLSRHDGLWLHVSAGLGTSMYAPVRFACRPEATVVDLVADRRDRTATLAASGM